MRLPNGYGSVIKLKGKRRKPYAVRTSEISEFVEIDAPKEPPSNILRDFVRYNFKWQWRKQVWSAISSEPVLSFAEDLMQEHQLLHINIWETYKKRNPLQYGIRR